jgi:glycerol-1-phosphate dehydrogenase [NAD(P)+]
VLYSAAVTAALREKLQAIKPPFDAFKLDRAAWENEIKAIYTQAADGVIELQDKVGLYNKLDNAQFAEKWDEICAILREAPSAAVMEGYVNSIGLDMKEFYQFYGNDTVKNAIRYAKDLKDRYSVLWICYALGVC